MPSVKEVNPLGMVFVMAAGNGAGELFTTFSVHDINATEKQIYDTQDLLIETSVFGMSEKPIYISNMETGDRWFLRDARGNLHVSDSL